jgi:hypothetical protein
VGAVSGVIVLAALLWWAPTPMAIALLTIGYAAVAVEFAWRTISVGCRGAPELLLCLLWPLPVLVALVVNLVLRYDDWEES